MQSCIVSYDGLLKEYDYFSRSSVNPTLFDTLTELQSNVHQKDKGEDVVFQTMGSNNLGYGLSMFQLLQTCYSSFTGATHCLPTAKSGGPEPERGFGGGDLSMGLEEPCVSGYRYLGKTCVR